MQSFALPWLGKAKITKIKLEMKELLNSFVWHKQLKDGYKSSNEVLKRANGFVRKKWIARSS